MDDRHDISKPKEGFHTLVAEFAFLHFDKAVREVRQLRENDTPEGEIVKHLEAHYHVLDEATKKKIYQISLGLTPRNDIAPEQVAERREIREATQEIELKESLQELQSGSVIFFEGKRWVISAREDDRLVLKQF